MMKGGGGGEGEQRRCVKGTGNGRRKEDERRHVYALNAY